MHTERSELLTRMHDGEFVTSIQIDPPNGPDTSGLFVDIERLKDAKVKLVDINSSRRLSQDSILLAAHIATHVGLEVIPHVTTRDSSMEGLLGQILAAYSFGNIRNFLVITGDPYETSLTMHTNGVFHGDSIRALQLFDEHLRKSPRANLNISLAAAVNQNEADTKREASRLEAKIDAGADFFMSQPVFDANQAHMAFRFYRQHSNKPLIMGLWPLGNIKTVENIKHDKITGVSIPNEVYEEACGFRENEGLLRAWSFEQTAKLIEKIKQENLAQGVYIVAPLRKPGQLVDLVERINTI